MPDQNSAATEHAIMQEIASPLENMPDDPVGSVANHDFPLVLRGYDRVAVDAYVKHVTQLVAELYATRSPEGAVRRALERVGSEVSAILQRAHETAEQITSQSRAEAEERLMRARAEAEQLETSARQQALEIKQAAEVRMRDLDADVDRIWAERDRIVADVRKLAEDLELLAGAAATRFPAASTDEAEAIRAADEPDSDATEAASGPDPDATAVASGPDSDATAAFEPAVRVVAEPVGPLAAAADAEEAVRDEPHAGASEPDEDQGHDAAPTVALRPAQHPKTIRLHDLLHLGRERAIGCWQVGEALIDPGPASCLEVLLEALGDERPQALLLTHIHLDHAGAAGSLVKRWPELEVYVHEQGAPHLIDPSRLIESARRLYGVDMDRLWGEVLPVPAANIRALHGGEELLDHSFEVAYTPGHASHHVAYLHDGTAFVGDTAGVRISPRTMTIPPTPPPDIDIEAWHASIERILAWNPDRLAITHFGWSEDVDGQLDELAERLDTWAALARTEDLDTFAATIRKEIEADSGRELLPVYEQVAPPEQLYLGLDRYWRKRAEREQEAATRTSLPAEDRPVGPVPPAAASTHAGRSSAGGAGQLS